MPHSKFLILTSSRSGSTWLIDLLNMQTGVEAHGELFLNRPRLTPAIAGRADYRRFIEVHGTPRLTRIAKVVSYLNRLYQAPGIVGFKLMYTQLRRHPEILAYLAVRRILVVHLVRQNQIDILISEELARVTGTSHIQAGAKEVAIPKVYLNPSTLLDRIQRRSTMPAKARRLVRFTGCPFLEVTYEALLEGEHEFARICRFLDIPNSPIRMASNLEKRGTRSHRDAVENYDEVRRVLSSTSFESLLR